MALAPPVSPSLLPGVWRADRLGHAGVAAVSSGFPSLNAQLPGDGWPLGVCTELIAPEPGIGELRLLVPALRQLSRERKVVVLLAPPHVPYAPALAAFNINLDYLIVVQATQAADRLWAVEQVLRSASFGALLAWLPQGRTRPEHLRRIQLAAQGARGPVFLFRPLPAQFESSPAPLRLLLLPRPQQQLSVQILKRRGPLLAQPLLLDLPQPPSALRPGRPLHPLRTGAASPLRPVSGQPSLQHLPDGLTEQGTSVHAERSITQTAQGLLRTAHATPPAVQAEPIGGHPAAPVARPH